MSDSVTRETLLDLDLDEAWRAVTEPGELERWLGEEVDIDPVEGGELRVRTHDGGEREGTVEVVEEPERLAWRWHPVGDPGPATTVSIELLPDGDGTRIRVVESGFEALPVASVAACALLGGVAWEARLDARAQLAAMPAA